jgi:hypothetical protein
MVMTSKRNADFQSNRKEQTKIGIIQKVEFDLNGREKSSTPKWFIQKDKAMIIIDHRDEKIH